MEGAPDLKQQYREEAARELENYRANKAAVEAGDEVPGSRAAQLLAQAIEDGATYADLGTTPEEIEAVVGAEAREKLDQRETQ